MITAVDTSVLLDVLLPDVEFGKASARVLKRCLQEGALVACPLVWAETATFFESVEEFLNAFETLRIEYSPLLQQSSLVASEAWRNYRASGGRRDRIAADFLIGAHAQVQCQRLLTRDQGFHRSHFSPLAVISPADI